MNVAYLSSSNRLPGAPNRREDGFEHDHTMSLLRPAFADRDLRVQDVAWDSFDPSRFDAVVIGTTWDYWDRPTAFLRALDTLADSMPVFNSPDVVRWNIDKGCLLELADRGIPSIPTVQASTADGVLSALRHFDCDRVVVKRQVGAGAAGQFRAR